MIERENWCKVSCVYQTNVLLLPLLFSHIQYMASTHMNTLETAKPIYRIYEQEIYLMPSKTPKKCQL